MDAFEKLAKLAGASVESVGDGLPRTRAEALALGVARYFTGKPCKRGHAAARGAASGNCCECRIHWDSTPERKEYMHRQNTSLRRKNYDRQANLARAGDAALFAINQAWRAASLAKAVNDIVPQCPEPQRSQLQALVDRIKADPQAGKAVVGLLRTMRELRKAELAEMRAAGDHTP